MNEEEQLPFVDPSSSGKANDIQSQLDDRTHLVKAY